MCGIYAHIYNDRSQIDTDHKYNIKNRGPDNTTCTQITTNVEFCFHRLKINDMSDNGNQPLTFKNITIICNGEIYNSDNLKENFSDVVWKSTSDCEVLLHMYKQYGFKEMCSKIDGVFAIVLYDSDTNHIYVGRDPFGVRPMYVGMNDGSDIEVASEMKAIHPELKVCQFPPGSYMKLYVEKMKYTEPEKYIEIDKNLHTMVEDYDFACARVKDTFTEAVKKRMMSERPIGCLLSGGLDSSLVSSIVAREFKKQSKGSLNTFSIGFQGSTDLVYAKKVATHIGSNHHEILMTEKDFLKAIPEVIYAIESYDTTTVRASVGNYLISKYIKENTNITVVFNGDGSDEVAGGYLYIKNAPSKEEFHKECIDLIENIHYFDVLRSDRSMSSRWSLESRTPFLDKEFVRTYLEVPVEYRVQSSYGIEKSLLRNAFKDEDLLPVDVLYRTKEAFSDGVSGKENSWHTVVQKFVDSQVSDQEFNENKQGMTHNITELKESYYYRKIFQSLYPHKDQIIPRFWMPKWTNVKDPSARELNNNSPKENL